MQLCRIISISSLVLYCIIDMVKLKETPTILSSGLKYKFIKNINLDAGRYCLTTLHSATAH